jgi:hypothetical protein
MDIYWSTFSVIFGLYICGFILSLIISFMKCSKVSPSISALEGVWWTLLPSTMYFLANWSTYIRDIFALPLKSWFSLSEEYSHVVGVAYFMMLGSWISTTRMLHTTESQVCVPDAAELKKFEEDLEKELKEKEAAKNNGDTVSTVKTSS